MRPKNDDVACVLSVIPTEHPCGAAYRQVNQVLRELHREDHNTARMMKNTPVPELGNRTLQEAVLAVDAEKVLL